MFDDRNVAVLSKAAIVEAVAAVAIAKIASEPVAHEVLWDAVVHVGGMGVGTTFCSSAPAATDPVCAYRLR
jgi:hypothetical protein